MANENTTEFLDVIVNITESDVETVSESTVDTVVSPIADSDVFVEFKPVIENVVDHTIIPENPNTTLGQEIYVHVPLATSKIKGIASFESTDFRINGGHISLRNKIPSQIIAGMTIDENGLLTIIYNDGTEVYYQFPIKYENPIYRKLLTIIGFKSDSFVEMSSEIDGVEYTEYWLALPPKITNFNDADFITAVDEVDVFDDDGHVLNGYKTKDTDVFKAEDGSVLIMSPEPFDGRITLLGGAVFEGKYLLPEGGDKNDILIKLSDQDYDCGWDKSSANNPEVSSEDLLAAFK